MNVVFSPANVFSVSKSGQCIGRITLWICNRGCAHWSQITWEGMEIGIVLTQGCGILGRFTDNDRGSVKNQKAVVNRSIGDNGGHQFSLLVYTLAQTQLDPKAQLHLLRQFLCGGHPVSHICTTALHLIVDREAFIPKGT